MSLVRAAVLYTIVVFAFGFLFGTVRELVLAPMIGRAWAGLAEVPFMLAAILFGAWVATRRESWRPARRLAIGALSLALVLALELGLAPFVRGSVAAWFASFTPLSLASAALLWLAHALAPLLVRRRV